MIISHLRLPIDATVRNMQVLAGVGMRLQPHGFGDPPKLSFNLIFGASPAGPGLPTLPAGLPAPIGIGDAGLELDRPCPGWKGLRGPAVVWLARCRLAGAVCMLSL
jgi:hypothetical protein